MRCGEKSQDAEYHRQAFLALFRQRIAPGRIPEPDEPVRWLLHVNPIRRPEDREILRDGLARAGLCLPRDP